MGIVFDTKGLFHVVIEADNLYGIHAGAVRMVQTIINADGIHDISKMDCNSIFRLFQVINRYPEIVYNNINKLPDKISYLKEIIIRPAAAVLNCTTDNYSLKTAARLLTGHYISQMTNAIVNGLGIQLDGLCTGEVFDFCFKYCNSSDFESKFTRFQIGLQETAAVNSTAQNKHVICDDTQTDAMQADGKRDIPRAQSIALLYAAFVKLGVTQSHSSNDVIKFIEAVTGGKLTTNPGNTYSKKHLNDELRDDVRQLLDDFISGQSPEQSPK